VILFWNRILVELVKYYGTITATTTTTTSSLVVASSGSYQVLLSSGTWY